MDIDEKLEELDYVIDGIDRIIDKVGSEDIINSLIAINCEFEKEKQDLKNKQS